jgi:sigma-B regulation protein RsbU (phosphoserine phosphatase)
MALSTAAALAIHNARMAASLVEQERMRKELELAREIQMGLLPRTSAVDFPVRGINYPALEVSGDFYDYFRREDGKIYFNLADVSGKGMNSALLMAKASSLLHHLAKSIDDPGEMLSRVNDELCETVSHGMFITIVSGFIDPEKGIIQLSNAGHQPPLYFRNDGTFEEIPASALPIGILPATDFPVTTIEMQGGNLYLFTDGVTESLDANGEPLEMEGLIRLIQANAGQSPVQQLENIATQIRNPDINQRDDITMMVIDCSPR